MHKALMEARTLAFYILSARLLPLNQMLIGGTIPYLRLLSYHVTSDMVVYHISIKTKFLNITLIIV